MLRSEDDIGLKNSVSITERTSLKDPANRPIIILKNQYLFVYHKHFLQNPEM